MVHRRAFSRALAVASQFAVFVSDVNALDWTATPFNPPSIPLAVRSPYLSAWLPQGSGAALNDVWPQFWAGQTLGWAGFAKVDGQSYSFLGSASVSGASFAKATQKSFTFTSTQSTFVLSAGPVDLTVNFLSPTETDDLVKLSTPLSYMTVSATSTDGASHSVQVYSDITGEWNSGVDSWTVNWTTTTDGPAVIHQSQTVAQAEFEEVNDHAQYGSVYYALLKSDGVTYQTGSDVSVRGQFLNNSKLANTLDTNFRAVSDSWPVFGLAQDIGTGNTTAVFVVGHIRDPAVQYVVAGNAKQDRSYYFWSQFGSANELIVSFLNDYGRALSAANDFDAKVEADTKKISDDYTGIVALSIRQALGASEVTISKADDGSWNTSDVLYFMKEISSDGNTNTVDVIFPAWPLYLYTNPKLGKYLLEILFRYQATGLYPNKWSVHDVGAHFPKAIGHNDGNDEAMPVEESGNMLIMALSYALKANDTSQLQQYEALLDQWTQFLITDSLIPANQISTDDFAGPLANQTNLAIKGIIGIKAMSVIADLLGDKDKSANYSSIAADYVQQWQTLAMSSTGDHLTLAYGNSSSWGLTYNLFADKLLKFDLFPQSIYEMQTAWYKTVANPFGVPLDTRHTYTKSDWEIWTASIMTDTSVRDIFISAVKKWASDGEASQPFGDLYDTITGDPLSFRARPVVGGHLALLVV